MRTLVGGLVVLALAISGARAEPIKIVAAERVYGGIAEQIGGTNVAVISILIHPNQDPHEFEANAATARAIADARLVIYNGPGYDPWAMKLLSASKSPSRDEWYRAERGGDRSLRNGPADARGQGAALQHPDRTSAGRTHAHARESGRRARRRNHRDRARREELPGVDGLATRRARPGAWRAMSAPREARPAGRVGARIATGRRATRVMHGRSKEAR